MLRKTTTGCFVVGPLAVWCEVFGAQRSAPAHGSFSSHDPKVAQGIRGSNIIVLFSCLAEVYLLGDQTLNVRETI